MRTKILLLWEFIFNRLDLTLQNSTRVLFRKIAKYSSFQDFNQLTFFIKVDQNMNEENTSYLINYQFKLIYVNNFIANCEWIDVY